MTVIMGAVGFGDAGMMDFNFEGMEIDGYEPQQVPPQPPADGNTDAGNFLG